MKKALIKYLKIIWESMVNFVKDNTIAYSASIAFFTIFSLPGVLIIMIKIAGFFFGEKAVRGELQEQIEILIGADSAAQIELLLENIHLSEYALAATLIGVGALLFGATSVFISIQDGLNVIFNVRSSSRRVAIKYLLNRLMSFAMVVSIGFVMIVSLLVDAVMVIFREMLQTLLQGNDFGLIKWLNYGISFLVVGAVFAAIYKVLPHAKIKWRDIFWGSLVSTLLFVAGKYLIGLYVGNSTLGTAYGAAGSLVVLLIWVYYSSIILLYGAEFMEVNARWHGREIQPSKGAVRVLIEEVEIPATPEPEKPAKEKKRQKRRKKTKKS